MAGSSVVGPDANGAASTGAPVQIAGDYNGLVKRLKVGSDGSLSISAVVGSEMQLIGRDGLTLADVIDYGLKIHPPTPATATVTSPASVTITVATVLAANTARYGAAVYNESGAICYLKLGATATLTSYTVQVAIGGYYEVPYGYTGILTGITLAGTAVLRVTEFTI